MKYAKLWAALSAAVVVAGSLAADGHITLPEGIAIVSAFLGAFTVHQVTNAP